MMLLADCYVSVVVALHRPLPGLADWVIEVRHTLQQHFAHYELILVDDGGAETLQPLLGDALASEPGIRLLRLMRRSGDDAAVAAGLDTAIGDVAVIMSPVLDPPDLLPEMVRRVRTSNRIVIGTDAHPIGEPAGYRLAKSLFLRLADWLMEAPPPRHATRFAAFNRTVLNAVTRMGSHLPHLVFALPLIGGDPIALPYRRRPGPWLKQELRAWHIPAMAMTAFVRYSRRPLRLVSLLGLAASFFNLLYIGYIAGVIVFKHHIAEGWVTLSLQSATMFFAINLTLAVIAEYLLKLTDETRPRPSSLIIEEVNSAPPVLSDDRRNVVTSPLTEPTP
jgi:hypothetical protein